MPPPHIALLGGINMDVSVHAHHALRAGDSNAGRVQCSPGGVARNVAENLLRLGADARLLGVLGDDVFGQALWPSGAAMGLDWRPMIGTRHDGRARAASIASSSELHCPSLSLVLRTIAASLMASCSCARGNAPTYRTRARAVAGAAASAASVASTVCAFLASSTGPTMRREMCGSLACHWVIAE